MGTCESDGLAVGMLEGKYDGSPDGWILGNGVRGQV